MQYILLLKDKIGYSKWYLHKEMRAMVRNPEN